MHLASSSKVERLVDVSAKLLKEGYDAGYRQGRVKGFSVGVGAGFVLAVALWMGMAMVAANAAERYPLNAERQAFLMSRAAALFYRWPKDREPPTTVMVWFSPEWFTLSRPMTERAVWGTIEAGRIVMNEAVLRNEFLSREPVLGSLLLHEQVHILQRLLDGPATGCADLARREAEAYAVQAAFLRENGVMLALDPEPPNCE